MYQFIMWIEKIYPKGLGPGSFSLNLTSSWKKCYWFYKFWIPMQFYSLYYVPNFQVHRSNNSRDMVILIFRGGPTVRLSRFSTQGSNDSKIHILNLLTRFQLSWYITSYYLTSTNNQWFYRVRSNRFWPQQRVQLI